MPVSTRRRALVPDETISFRQTRRRLLTTLEESPDDDKTEQTVVQQVVSTSIKLETPRKKTKKPRTVTPTTPRAPPKDWEAIYSLVQELRQDYSAPVDSNGSEALPDRSQGVKVFRFQVLIALMLSSQTKDGVVGDTMRALQQHGLTVESISNTPAETLNKLIGKVGFHNNKTKYIKQTVEILKRDYDGDIPPTAEKMMKLPGVGPKMAYIVENVAFGRSTGIGIDTHMHRMYNKLGWVTSKNPEQTRVQLESWLPREYWPTVNILWVGFGQEVQQFTPKVIEKALTCSRPADALRLLKRLGVDLKAQGAKMGVEEDIKAALKK